MSTLRLELLGDLQIRAATGTLATISAKKAQALLAYLAVKPAQRVSREKIAALLWSSTGPDQARQSLRQTLSMLRKEVWTIEGLSLITNHYHKRSFVGSAHDPPI